MTHQATNARAWNILSNLGLLPGFHTFIPYVKPKEQPWLDYRQSTYRCLFCGCSYVDVSAFYALKQRAWAPACKKHDTYHVQRDVQHAQMWLPEDEGVVAMRTSLRGRAFGVESHLPDLPRKAKTIGATTSF